MSRLRVCSLVGRLPLYLSQELSLQRQYCNAKGRALGSQGILAEYNRYIDIRLLQMKAITATLQPQAAILLLMLSLLQACG